MDAVAPIIAFDPALLLARRTCYRFLALTLADPGYGTFTQLNHPETRRLVSEAAQIIRGERRARARPLSRGERSLDELDPAEIFDRAPGSASQLNTLYEHTFGLLGGSKCPPYETEYLPSKFTFQRSNMLADVAGFYRAFGLQTSSSRPDRPDHIAVECEFLAQLLQLQLRSSAREGGAGFALEDSDHQTCQRAVHRFLADHFAWWAPAFARLLSQQDPGGFYAAVAQFLAAYVAAERALNGVAQANRDVEPSSIESADECSGCLLSIQ